MTGKGIDILAEETAEQKKLAWWVGWCGGVVALIGLLWVGIRFGGQSVADLMGDYIAAPTRYQSGPQLIDERYSFMLREGAISIAIGSLYLALFFAWFRKWLPGKALLPLLAILLLGDLWRVNDRFFVVTQPPQVDRKAAKNDIVEFLKPRIDHYRMQPLNDENAHYYADNGFANISAYVTISERRYKEFLDGISLTSAMPDIMNLRYLIMSVADFEAQKGALSGKYASVFTSTRGSVVLENKAVLPKAWLVPSVAVVGDPRQRVGIMNSDSNFNPAQIALVESAPPLPLASIGQVANAGNAQVDVYSPNRITVKAAATTNALLILGEKYYRWWYAYVDGKKTEIVPVDHVLRGVYLTPGEHKVEFVFDPLPFKVGKWLTLASFAFFACLLGREVWLRQRHREVNGEE
jgi:hypothetical protein